jgi:hypothetical protein
MALLAPLFMQNEDYTATEFRQLATTVLRTGVIDSPDLKVTQRAAGTNMTVDVAAGTGVVEGTDAVGQGVYVCGSTDVVNVTIPDAPSTGNSQITLIVQQVRDDDQNLGPNKDQVITAVSGTPASTPTEPTIPDSAQVLAKVTVASGTAAVTNAMIVDRRFFARRISASSSTTLPLGRVGDMVMVTNTNRVMIGQSNTTWLDIRGAQEETFHIGSVVLGTPPTLGTTVQKVAKFSQTVGAISGDGGINVPAGFTGIYNFFVTPQLGTTPVIIGHRTSVATTATFIPVKMFDMGGDLPVGLTGNVICFVEVTGW